MGLVCGTGLRVPVFTFLALTPSGRLLTLFQPCDFVLSLPDVFEERDND